MMENDRMLEANIGTVKTFRSGPTGGEMWENFSCGKGVLLYILMYFFEFIIPEMTDLKLMNVSRRTAYSSIN